jgi:enterochelin esterase-like enzyme
MKALVTLMLGALCALCGSGCVSSPAKAPTTAPTSQPAPMVSPEVHADRTVTFRVRAPKAREVTVNADWMPDRTTIPMQKAAKGETASDTDGVWSTTVGPLEPGMAIYSFNIDGIAMADPVNPRMKLRAQTSASLVNIPGDGSEAFAVRDVPRGFVRLQWHKSPALDGQTREFRVYTPPGYDENPGVRYPVMYLLHGNNDTASGWTDVGQANFILDNLLADKKAVPMIVVMPWGHAAPFRAPRGSNTPLFQKYLLEDLVPLVDQTYRVLPGPQNRALVGLSMGGEQALGIGLSHLDTFATIGAFSPSIPRDAETRLKATLDGRAASNAKIRLLWIACGRQEGRFGSNEQFVKLLADHEIQSTFVGLDGLHNYTLWRKFLTQLTPLLFREGA